MRQEQVRAVQGSTVITDSGAKIAISSQAVAPGDVVWTDGQYVFGRQQGGGVVPVPMPQLHGLIELYYADDRPAYRMRTIDDGLSIIAEGNAVDAQDWNNGLFIYGKQKFAWMYFGQGSVTVKEFYNSNKTTYTVNLPNNLIPSARQAYYDSDDNLIWAVFITDSRTILKLLHYKNDQLANMIDVMPSLRSAMDNYKDAIKADVTNKFINNMAITLPAMVPNIDPPLPSHQVLESVTPSGTYLYVTTSDHAQTESVTIIYNSEFCLYAPIFEVNLAFDVEHVDLLADSLRIALRCTGYTYTDYSGSIVTKPDSVLFKTDAWLHRQYYLEGQLVYPETGDFDYRIWSSLVCSHRRSIDYNDGQWTINADYSTVSMQRDIYLNSDIISDLSQDWALSDINVKIDSNSVAENNLPRMLTLPYGYVIIANQVGGLPSIILRKDDAWIDITTQVLYTLDYQEPPIVTGVNNVVLMFVTYARCMYRMANNMISAIPVQDSIYNLQMPIIAISKSKFKHIFG